MKLSSRELRDVTGQAVITVVPHGAQEGMKRQRPPGIGVAGVAGCDGSVPLPGPGTPDHSSPPEPASQNTDTDADIDTGLDPDTGSEIDADADTDTDLDLQTNAAEDTR
jgi:hypothetical protein